MIDEEKIMPFNFFVYGGVYSGEHNGMRYRIYRSGEKPEFKLMAAVWQGPFAFAAVPPESRTEKLFSFDEDGRKEAVRWLLTQYEERRQEWENAPAILDTAIELDEIYRREK